MQATCTDSTKIAIESPESITIQQFNTLLKYVNNTPNCACFYCKAKNEVPFLNQKKEVCSMTMEEEKQFLPREIFNTFSEESVENQPTIDEYCATVLLTISLEQHKFLGPQIVNLAANEPLKYSDILASTSPFYNQKTKLIQVGGRIGMGGSGRRDQNFLEDNSAHYKIILPHKSKFTAKIALNSHQRNQCCSAAFTRLVLNENFYIPRATSTIKSAILKCDACKLARSANEKLEPPTGNVKEFRLPHPSDSELNRPYRTVYFDFKGPIHCNDDRQFKTVNKKKSKKEEKDEDRQKLKVYILSMTCAMTRHTVMA